MTLPLSLSHDTTRDLQELRVNLSKNGVVSLLKESHQVVQAKICTRLWTRNNMDALLFRQDMVVAAVMLTQACSRDEGAGF